jgi:hypothetical protein
MSHHGETMRTPGTFALAMLLAVTLSMSPAVAQQPLKDKIVGTWKVTTWESLRPNGDVVNIWMGPHPTGVIIYEPTGYMAVEIMADPRATFAQDPATTPPTPDEFKDAFFGYYAYWGTYAINEAGDGVIHTVLGSERPPEVGRKYPRHIAIDGTKLVITTPPYKAGMVLPHDRLERMDIPVDEELVNRLTFERVQ